MKNFICKRCNKKIVGPIKVNTYQKKLGHRMIDVVDYYCKECFQRLNKEKSWNAHRKKKGHNS
jgi:RNase P subunit RPR2